jgi:hypothetical protein
VCVCSLQIVAYAAERCIEVVPEIELPGHCVAALAAYPHLSCEQDPAKLLPSTVLVCLRCLPGVGGVLRATLALLTEVPSP